MLETGDAGQRWVRGVVPEPSEVAALLPYERMLWEQVGARTRSTGRVLTDRLVPDSEVGEWRAHFSRLVDQDAKAPGLVGPRARRWLRLTLGWVCAAFLVLRYAIDVATHRPAGQAVFECIAILGVVVWLGKPVPRGAGIRVAARCRELRRRLTAQPPSVPGEPGDRTAACAVALGVNGKSTPLVRT